MHEHLKSCHCCGLIQQVVDGVSANCARCEASLETWLGHLKHNRVSAALALTALIVYLPAITLPFLRIEQLGQAHQSSLLSGIRTLFEERQYFVGVIVLLFSIILPVFKLSALLFLSQRTWQLLPRHRALTYHLVEQLGRWGMLDVLLVAVMVAFIKLGGLVEFGAGAGLVLFATFVILSLCASATFDPHCLWDEGLFMSDSAPGQPSLNSAMEPKAASRIPQAVPSTKSAFKWSSFGIWIIPALALLLVAWVVVSGMLSRGREIVVTFVDGHGIEAGNELKHHGIVVGEVEEAVLSENLKKVEVRLRLTPEADDLAREGARFWIVRPQANLTGVSGLETIVGAHYLMVLPPAAGSPLQSQFIGLEVPPLLDLEQPGGVEIVLQSTDAEGLTSGSGIYYRRIRIGGLISSGLSADGGAVEARAYILPDYRELIRERSVFWNMAGFRLQGGLTELSLQMGPVESVLRGGIGLAVPPGAGKAVTDGHRFVLQPRAEKDWEKWRPDLNTQTPDLPANLPVLAAVALEWKHDGFVRNPLRTKSGSAVPVEGGYLLPGDLVAVEGAVAESVKLRIGDAPMVRPETPTGSGEVVRIKQEHSQPAARIRRAEHPENGFLVTASSIEPQFIAATHYQQEEDAWTLDPAYPVTAAEHGGAIVAAEDGAVIGIMLIKGSETRVVPVGD